MRFALALIVAACGAPTSSPQTAPPADVTIEWASISPRWVEAFVRTDGDDFRAWSVDSANAVRIAEVRHILVRAKKDAPDDERKKARARAEAILQRLAKGEDFVAIAQSESEDTSKIRGGSVGTDTSKFVEPFRVAADALKPGERSGIVETQFGFHILAKDPITPETTAAAYRKWHAGALAKTLAARTVEARANSPTMDAALATALGAVLGDAAVKDADRPMAKTFDPALEGDAIDACADRKEQLRRAAARARREPILLCGEMTELARFAAKKAPRTGLVLPIPPRDTDPLAAWAAPKN